jgi:ABC-type polar amino acid transport system ATPase subunit
LKQSSLRSRVAVVPQDTVLFNDSLLHNLRYGRADASVEEVLEAATCARLDGTLALMPDGLDTMVGERGVKLSGGEKQRVAIARAFLRQPRLLLADEATSALDTATEIGILQSLQEVASGRTAVFVAHRLSTVRSCDVVVVMENGKIVESGASHLTLVPIRPRSRCELHSLRTFSPGVSFVSLRPQSLGFNPDTPRRLSTPSDAFRLRPDLRLARGVDARERHGDESGDVRVHVGVAAGGDRDRQSGRRREDERGGVFRDRDVNATSRRRLTKLSLHSLARA